LVSFPVFTARQCPFAPRSRFSPPPDFRHKLSWLLQTRHRETPRAFVWWSPPPSSPRLLRMATSGHPRPPKSLCPTRTAKPLRRYTPAPNARSHPMQLLCTYLPPRSAILLRPGLPYYRSCTSSQCILQRPVSRPSYCWFRLSTHASVPAGAAAAAGTKHGDGAGWCRSHRPSRRAHQSVSRYVTLLGYMVSVERDAVCTPSDTFCGHRAHR